MPHSTHLHLCEGDWPHRRCATANDHINSRPYRSLHDRTASTIEPGADQDSSLLRRIALQKTLFSASISPTLPASLGTGIKSAVSLKAVTEQKFFQPALGAVLAVFCGLGLWTMPAGDRKSTRLNPVKGKTRMPSSAWKKKKKRKRYKKKYNKS